MAFNNLFHKTKSGSVNTPGIMVRNAILNKLKAVEGSDVMKLTMFFFLLAQIAVVSVLLFTSDTRLSFFKECFSSNLLGGIVMILQEIAFGLTNLKSFGDTLKAIPHDYAQYLFAGLQYSALLILFRILQRCQWPKVFQFIHGVFFILSTGLLNSFLAKIFLLSEKNLYVRLCAGYLAGKGEGGGIKYIWQPALWWLLVILLLFGAANALMESAAKMIRYILIVAGGISIMALLEFFFMNRANNVQANVIVSTLSGWGNALMGWNGLIPAVIFIVTIAGFCWTLLTMAEEI